jgi:CheY-like chemotaxis protein/class 3 adenylate cyclase
LTANVPKQAKILIVDDQPFNVDYLEQELEDLGFLTVSATNGQEALEQVAEHSPDMILLDIMMPIMSGFEVLEHLKADQHWRDIPVVVISAMNDIDSVVRGIELGAEDYLPKPIDPILLQARLNAGLERKRLRDQEVEYLMQVEHLTDAAQALEKDKYDPEYLKPVTARSDALGNLARIFDRMAHEVHSREQRLRLQLEQLRLDLQEQEEAAMETVVDYLPMDRRHALAQNRALPDRCQGAALFADISGFTALTGALANELGRERGAEELVRHLNRVYGALINQVHRYGGSVVNFSGDAITCWFDVTKSMNQPELSAVTCALAMQEAISEFSSITTAAGTMISFAMKVTVVAGSARRFLVGDPRVHNLEVLAGELLEILALGDLLATKGDVLVHEPISNQFDHLLTISGIRTDEASGHQFTAISAIKESAPASPWPELPSPALTADLVKSWLQPPIYETVRRGMSQFISELRPATVLFLGFRGIDYDHAEDAGSKLDGFVRWAQEILRRYHGHLIQLTIGDKGSYFYAAFGAPTTNSDHQYQAVQAALDLQAAPEEFNYIKSVQTGLASGQMRVGTFGGSSRRTYGVMGEKANLAARLMEAANGGIYCDEAVYLGARDRINFVDGPTLQLKGIEDPVSVYLPKNSNSGISRGDERIVDKTIERALQEVIKYRIDNLPPAPMLALKVASVIGSLFTLDVLEAVFPDDRDRKNLSSHMDFLMERGFISPLAQKSGPGFAFADTMTRDIAYELMLYAQRRQLHRAVAEWYERTYASKLSPFYALLAYHWARAEDAARTIDYLEKAGEEARKDGDLKGAQVFVEEALTLESNASVLSRRFRAAGEG